MAKNDVSSSQFTSKICLEEPDTENPFVAQQRYIRGYPINELWQHSSFIEMLLLMFTGEIPNHTNAALLERLFIGLMGSGPRDTAVRAAMTAGISKTSEEHLLPIGLLAGSGECNGASEVKAACKFIVKSSRSDAKQLATELQTKLDKNTAPSEHSIAPGFGSYYGCADPVMARLAQDCFQLLPDSRIFNWCQQFSEHIQLAGQGWRASGLVAAVCIELGIRASEALAIYQLCKAPAIAAHGFEQTHLPLQSNPLLADEHYELLTDQ